MDKEVFTRLKTTPARLISWSTLTILQASAYLADLPRPESLPESFDICSHQGNVNDSLLIGAVAGYAANHAAERLLPNTSPRTRRGIILAGATAVGMASNSLVEFKFGQKLVGDDTLHNVFGARIVGDPLDTIYGTVAAGAASFVVAPDRARGNSFSSEE
jgi:hypothetical protein